MTKHKKWTLLLIAGIATLVVTAGAGVALAQTSDDTPDSGPQFARYAARPGFTQGWSGCEIDIEALLAEELGITVEILQTAQQEARDEGLKRAIEDGLITQEQADQISSWKGAGKFAKRGFDMRGIHPASGFGRLGNESLLANALDISVEELRSAQEKAHDAALAQAVDEGIITEEQSLLMQARNALKDYLATDEGLTEARENMQDAFQGAIQRAVAAGVITQEQADQFSNAGGPGFRDPGLFNRHRGGFGRMAPWTPPDSPAP